MTEELIMLEKACFKDFWSKQLLEEQLLNSDTFYKIEYENKQPVGFVLGTISEYEAELYRVGILKPYRNKGIGAKLLKCFTDEAFKKTDKIFLEVGEKNHAAVSLYQKHGFQKIAIRKNYYKDDNALIFVLMKKG